MEAEVQAGQHFKRPLFLEEAKFQNVINEEDIHKEMDKLKQAQLKIG